jgi:hypothetical protein
MIRILFFLVYVTVVQAVSDANGEYGHRIVGVSWCLMSSGTVSRGIVTSRSVCSSNEHVVYACGIFLVHCTENLSTNCVRMDWMRSNR